MDKLAEDAFDDQCTGANPRYPLIAELKQIMLDTFYGREYAEPFDSVSEAISAQPVQQTKVEKKLKSLIVRPDKTRFGGFLLLRQTRLSLSLIAVEEVPTR